MICRARPRYIFETDMKSSEPYEEAFWFNGGSKAAKFFFECYNLYYNKMAKIGIQSFTCESMLEAISESGSIAYIYDISLKDASLQLESVKSADLDIIVLTHYQGIPNRQYEDFANHCKENNIILFDDLSHGSDSFINGIKIGSLSNIYIESYAWDKPLTSLYGGKLVLNDLPDDFKQFLRQQYESKPIEKNRKAKDDLDTLEFLMRYTGREYYYLDFNYELFRDCKLIRKFWHPLLFTNKKYRHIVKLISKVYRRVQPNKEKEQILRLSQLKIDYLCSQYLRCKNSEKIDVCELKELLYGIDGITFFEEKNCDIMWNRFSFIDSSGEARIKLNSMGMEVGNYNWPYCLHDVWLKYKNVIVAEECHNSTLLSSYILNVPIWQYQQ